MSYDVIRKSCFLTTLRPGAYLYVLETAFTVQRALCTFEGKGHPVHEALCTFTGEGPCHPGAAKVGPNSLKFQMDAKVHLTPASQEFSLFGPFWPDVQTCPCTFSETCRHVSALAVRGPGGGG